MWQRGDANVLGDRIVVLGPSGSGKSTLARGISRLVTRERLWSGNRERLRDVLSTDPERSILAWGWTSYASYRADYAAAIHDETWAHLRWIRIRNRGEARALVLRGRAD